MKKKSKKTKMTNLVKILIAIIIVLVITIIVLLVNLLDDHDHEHAGNPCDVSCEMHPASGECHCHGQCGTPGCMCHGVH